MSGINFANPSTLFFKSPLPVVPSMNYIPIHPTNLAFHSPTTYLLHKPFQHCKVQNGVVYSHPWACHGFLQRMCRQGLVARITMHYQVKPISNVSIHMVHTLVLVKYFFVFIQLNRYPLDMSFMTVRRFKATVCAVLPGERIDQTLHSTSGCFRFWPIVILWWPGGVAKMDTFSITNEDWWCQVKRRMESARWLWPMKKDCWFFSTSGAITFYLWHGNYCV